MTDPRIEKLAEILTTHSIKIKKGDFIEISSPPEAQPLVLELMKRILEIGAFPRLETGMPGSGYVYFKYAQDHHIKHFPELRQQAAEKTDGFISIGAPENTKDLSNIDPKKIANRRKVTKPISELILKKDNWVILEYPTNALAQDAEMSLQEYEDFCFGACLNDWPAMEKKQTKLKEVFDKGEEVHILGEDTDLTFSIKGREAIKCFGTRNMPDGEVFMAPVDDSANGHIKYTYPVVYMGKEVDGVKLWFEKGKVIKATAEKNEEFLKEMIAMDEGASGLGEFGVGMNYNIDKFTKQILFDEKIGGTIHLALGMAYKEGGGKNESALHWDMIKDLRNGGKIILDGKTIQENGKFSFSLD
jgi:aminopeptidase|tara:strand:- start:1225 stop:2301 length:1077 start_codon:yes stop_codon:yes gene_type:complete